MSSPAWQSLRRSGLWLSVSLATSGCIFAGAVPDEPFVRPMTTGVAVLVLPRLEPPIREQVEQVIAGLTPQPTAVPPPATATPPPTTPAAILVRTSPPVSTAHVLSFTATDVQKQLNERLARAGSSLREATVELIEPDELIVRGRLPPPAGAVAAIKSVPLEVAFGVEVADGTPRLIVHRISSKGFKLPDGSQAALANRVAQVNTEAPALVPPGEKVIRIWIEGGLLKVELDKLA